MAAGEAAANGLYEGGEKAITACNTRRHPRPLSRRSAWWCAQSGRFSANVGGTAGFYVHKQPVPRRRFRGTGVFYFL